MSTKLFWDLTHNSFMFSFVLAGYCKDAKPHVKLNILIRFAYSSSLRSWTQGKMPGRSPSVSHPGWALWYKMLHSALNQGQQIFGFSTEQYASTVLRVLFNDRHYNRFDQCCTCRDRIAALLDSWLNGSTHPIRDEYSPTLKFVYL